MPPSVTSAMAGTPAPPPLLRLLRRPRRTRLSSWLRPGAPAQRRLPAAIAAYRALLSFAPSADALYGLGECYLGGGSTPTRPASSRSSPAAIRAIHAPAGRCSSRARASNTTPVGAGHRRLQGYLSATQVISPHVWSRIATCYEKTDDLNAAIAPRSAVVSGAWDTSMPSRPWSTCRPLQIREDYAAAAVTYDRILAIAKSGKLHRPDRVPQGRGLPGMGEARTKPRFCSTGGAEISHGHPRLLVADRAAEAGRRDRAPVRRASSTTTATTTMPASRRCTPILRSPQKHAGAGHYYAALSYRA